MHYLIDGYNLFFRTTRGEEGADFQKEREKMIQILAEQIGAARMSAILVFDSAWNEETGKTKIQGALEVHYTSRGESADDWIVEQVEQSERPIEITVVSSDRNLSWRSRNKGAKTMPSEEFMLFVRKLAIKKSKKIEKKQPPPSIVMPPKAETDLERYEKCFAEPEELPKQEKKKQKEPPLSDYERWMKAFDQEPGNGA